MADRSTTFLIGIDGDAGSIKDLVASVKNDLVKAVNDLQSASNKVKLFGDTEQQAAAAKDALNVAQAAVAHFTDEVNKAKAAGGGVGDALAQSLKDAQTAATAAEKAYAKSQTTLGKLDTQLTKAGVDTKNLATEQIRLSTALKQATTAAELQAAKTALGVKTFADIAPQLTLLNQQYNLLRTSGSLTLSEQIGLWAQYRTRVSDVKDEVPSLINAFQSIKASTVAIGAGITAVFGGATLAVVSAAKAYNEFNDSLLKGQATTNVSADRLDGLGKAAREIAVEFGDNAQTAVASLFQLIRQGVPEDNAITALRDSAIAAQGGIADLGKTVQLGITIINGYGQTADQLPKIYDQITVAAHNGGASIEELSDSIGSILPLARAAHVPFDQLLAALVALRKGGLDTGESISALQKFLTGLADPAVIAKFREFGINVGDLATTLEQISSKNLDLTQIKELGLDTRSLRGVVALTQGYQTFAGALKEVKDDFAGASAAQSAIVDKTQEDQIKRLAAAYDNLKIELGEVVSKDSTFISSAAVLLNSFTALAGAIKSSGTGINGLIGLFNPLTSTTTSLTVAVDSVVLRLLGLQQAAPKTADALDQIVQSGVKASNALSQTIGGYISQVQAQISAVQATIAKIRSDIGTFGTDLQKQILAAQGALTESLKAIDDASKAQLAALDTQNLSQQAKSQQSIDITKKAEADRLKVLQDSSTQIIAAFDNEARARLAAVKDNAAQTKIVEQQLLVDRKAILAQFVAAYTQQVSDLTKAEAGFIAQIKTIDQQRLDFNVGIENQIGALRAQSLGAYAVYGQKVSEIDQNIELARQANLKGEFDLAQKYATAAQSLVGGISTAVTENGAEVVSATTAQSNAVSKLRDIQGEYIKAANGTKAAAEEGRDAIVDQLTVAKAKLAEFTAQVNDLNTTLASKLKVQIEVDTSGIDRAFQYLDGKLAEKRKLDAIELDLVALKVQTDLLAENIKAGFVTAAQEGVDLIKAKLAAINDNAPELHLDTKKADEAIATLKTTVDDLARARDLALTAIAHVDEAKKALDDLTKDRDVNVTVHVKAVGDVNALGGAGGLSGGGVEAGVPEFKRGGMVPRLFARGGRVFGGRKVPGVGDRDTFGANLQGGSFVVRKSASKYYGDSLMSRLARGFTQRFATGGFAFPPAFQGLISSRLANGLSFDIGGGSTDNADLDDLESKLQQIVDASTNLPSSHNLPDIRTWAAALMERLKILPAEKLAPIREAIDDNFQLMLDAINVSRQFRVPATVGPDLFAFLFGRGGRAPTSDTVPAMLTPGEWVVNRGAVSKYGGNFMHAINNMAIPRAALARMIDPPQIHRFAEGGPVPGQASSTVRAVAERSSTTNFNFNGAGIGDLFSYSNFMRYIQPNIETHKRRSR